MHSVKLDDNFVRTDLIFEKNFPKKGSKETNYKQIKIITNSDNSYNYSTIFFDDVTDSTSSIDLEKVLFNELSKYIKVDSDDVFLVVGLGNSKSTPDSLGPLTVDKIIPTRYLFNLGDVEEGYSNVSTYKPDVIGNTGIESISIIKSIIDEIKATKVIIIDSLKAGNKDRLTKTIQITNSGINPGSGISNNRGEISKNTMDVEVIAIGVPTVVDIRSLINSDDDISFIVTPTNIDFVLDKLSLVLANSINRILHKNFNRQISIY